MNTSTISNQLRRTNRRSKKAREAFVAEQMGSTVAAQIYTLRSVNHMTQKKLAEAINSVQTRIPVLEDPSYQNYSVQTLLKIAAAFDVGLVVRFVPFKQLEDLAGSSTAEDLLPLSFHEEEKLLAACGDGEAIRMPVMTANSSARIVHSDLKPSNVIIDVGPTQSVPMADHHIRRISYTTQNRESQWQNP